MTTAIAGATATSVDDIPFNPHKRDYKKAGIIVAFCVIPVTLLVVFTYWPFIQMCGYSFYKMKYIGTPRFIGMKNYIDIFTRPELLATLKLSLYYMAGALIQVALALYLATVLAFHVRGGSFFKGAMFFPYLINGIAVGFIFKFSGLIPAGKEAILEVVASSIQLSRSNCLSFHFPFCRKN